MPKILIIEDRRENIVFIVNNILKPKGYDVITAMDGKTGLEKAERENPDLIITDLKLPRMNGLDVLERLREKQIYTPAIVMTFHGTEETAVRALRLGARDYLIKPFTFEEMQAALDRAFQPQPVSPESYLDKLKTQAKIDSLEEQLGKMKSLLIQRESLLKKYQRRASNNHTGLLGNDERLESCEKDNLRLNRMLSQAKTAFEKSEGRVNSLEETVLAQKAQATKYQKEAQRLAHELRNLSEAMRLMSQDMEQQLNRLSVAVAAKK